jgi:hypothetical protein
MALRSDTRVSSSLLNAIPKFKLELQLYDKRVDSISANALDLG